MKTLNGFLLLVLLALPLWVNASGDNVILVTLDGVRWQEVFRGLSDAMVADETLTPEPERLAPFAGKNASDKRQKLMPFFWSHIATEGAFLGNRDAGSYMHLDNPWYFSYPGYHEILSGFPDPAIDSNAKINNPNVTLLEWLHGQQGFAGKVAAFASWDVFPYIINTERSPIPVNAGFEIAPGQIKTEREKLLAEVLAGLPKPWTTVRNDAITHQFALEYLRRAHPRLTYISYGESDDFAHDGRYDQYADAIHRADQFISELWALVQADPFYKNNTTLIITTDHGRGEFPLTAWKHHGSKKAVEGYIGQYLKGESYPDGIVGAGEVWLAAIGPGIKARGLVSKPKGWSSSQVAATVASILGVDYNAAQPKAGAPMVELFAPAGAKDVTRPVAKILFGSCVHQGKAQPIWSAINRENADAFVFLGDNVYADTDKPEKLAAAYDTLKGKQGFQQLQRQTPVFATWDDHDYGDNDIGAENSIKSESRQLMLDFWGEPEDSPRRSQPGGIYTAYNLGPDDARVQLILLDTRWNRTPLKAVSKAAYKLQKEPKSLGPYLANKDDNAVLLGEDQWQWLAQKLKEPAKVRIIASSIQLLADFTGWESWANFPKDRQRMLDLLKSSNANGVVFISGDTHWAELMASPDEGNYPLWEITSSGLTEEWSKVSPNRYRVGEAHVGANYGVLRFDWHGENPQITVEIKDVEGALVMEKSLSFSALATQ